MVECPEPQISAQCPWKIPQPTKEEKTSADFPGIQSNLKPRDGTVNEWITSSEETEKTTGLNTETQIEL